MRSKTLWALIFFMVGCGRQSAEPQPKTEISLTEADLKFHDSREPATWYDWYRKGLSIQSESLDGALYCFNQATEAWREAYKQNKVPKKDPTDILLQKSYLFARMREPKWALVYAGRFGEYFPNDPLTAEARAHAFALSGDYRKAQELLGGKSSTFARLIAGMLQIQEGDRAGGRAMMVSAWKEQVEKSAAKNDSAWLKNFFWPLLPDEMQQILREEGLSPT
jgi:hypothetical protein